MLALNIVCTHIVRLLTAAMCCVHSQEIAPDWWRRMARISLDCPSSLPGFPLSVLSVPMENKYKCQQCLQVLRRPVQAQCGHRFCVHCFKQLTRYPGGRQTTYNRANRKPLPHPNALPSSWTCFSTACVFSPLLASGDLFAPKLLFATSSLTWLDWLLTLISLITRIWLRMLKVYIVLFPVPDSAGWNLAWAADSLFHCLIHLIWIFQEHSGWNTLYLMILWCYH